MRDPFDHRDSERPATPDNGLSPARLRRLADIEGWHFWFVGRRELLKGLLKRTHPARFDRMLDVGCGTGANAAFLSACGRQIVGMDVRTEGVEASVADGVRRATFVRGAATRLPFTDASFDAVTALDVLEHVDDHAALREMRRVLRPGGAMLLTVPAMPWLWSHRDTEAGHLRRYRRRGLVDLLKASRFELRHLNYYQCLLFPLVVARVFRRDSVAWRDGEESPRPIVNRLLSTISRSEARLARFVSWPFGSSLVALCRKPEHDRPL
jgi:ubiquinone/menaquinone biosynthesis C-methylase UbiE